jgi:uncharacterized protein
MMTAAPASDVKHPSPPHAAPVAERDRVQAMDVIRGVALLGILVVNMDFFAGTFAEMFSDEHTSTLVGVERAAWLLVQVVFAGKFISLFSLLFGAGIALQAMRLDRTRGAFSTSFLLLRRLVVLAVVGVVHATCIWYGDILWGYASLGWILILVRFLPTKAIWWAAASVLLLSVFCVTALGFVSMMGMEAAAAGREAASALPEIPDGPTSMELFREMGNVTQWSVIDPRWADFEAATYRYGPWDVAFALRLLQWVSSLPFIYLGFGAHLIGMFLLGTAAARSGVLGSAWASLQRQVALVCIPAGLFCCAVVPSLLLSGRAHADPLIAGMGSLNELGTTLLAVGYAGALARLAYAGPPALALFLARTGRMAFTIYLSMSVLMTGLFYWWGFGLFEQVGHVGRLGIALVTWAVLAAGAQLWLKAFTMGPLEWAWRMTAYLEVPPLLRRGNASQRESGA